jgi:hypothetical protein
MLAKLIYKMNFKILFILICFLSLQSFSQNETINNNAVAQTTKKKGNFYLMWGYTRAWYSKSTIHFSDRSNKYYPETGRYHNYDFTIYDAKASDRPDFDAIKDVVNITIPQFVVHGGYYFNDKHDFGIELSYDHTKYVVNNYQKVRVKGDFNGNYVDKDTILDPDNFLHFEHTDGANFWMVNFLKRWKVWEPSKKFNIGFVAKPGIGLVYPRTDVTMLGTRLNNNWHIAGWIAGVETALRIEFLRHGVFEFAAKGAYADYRKVLVLGAGGGKANHHFFAGQLTMTLGFML